MQQLKPDTLIEFLHWLLHLRQVSAHDRDRQSFVGSTGDRDQKKEEELFHRRAEEATVLSCEEKRIQKG